MNDRLTIFAIISGIALAIIYVGSAIAKLVLHFKWSGEECRFERSINTYLLYGGLVDIGWIILCLIAPCCGFNPKTYLFTRTTKQSGQIIKKEVKTKEHGGYGYYMILAAIGCLLASFSFSCFGNALILDGYQHVDFSNGTSLNYCHPSFFKGAFSIVIISDIWYAFLIFTITIICCFK